MSKHVYVNEKLGSPIVTIDMAGMPEALADRRTDVGCGFRGLLDSLGIASYPNRRAILGRRLEVIGSMAIMQGCLAAEGFDEKIEDVMAEVREVTTPRNAETTWIHRITDRLTKVTLPGLPDDTPFPVAVSELVRPFVDASHNDMTTVHVGETAFWLNVPQQPAAETELEGAR